MRKRLVNALIYDGGLRKPYLGELTVVGDIIESVIEYPTPGLLANVPKSSEKEAVVDCGGNTLMPGLVEGHAHLIFADTFNNKSFDFEEHMLITVTAHESRASAHDSMPLGSHCKRRSPLSLDSHHAAEA